MNIHIVIMTLLQHIINIYIYISIFMLVVFVSVTLLHKICTAWNAGAWPFDLAKFCSSTKALCDAASSACDLAPQRWNPREMCWKKLNVTLVSWNCMGILKNDSVLPPLRTFFFSCSHGNWESNNPSNLLWYHEEQNETHIFMIPNKLPKTNTLASETRCLEDDFSFFVWNLFT